MGIPETALRVEKESSNTIDNLREAKISHEIRAVGIRPSCQ